MAESDPVIHYSYVVENFPHVALVIDPIVADTTLVGEGLLRHLAGIFPSLTAQSMSLGLVNYRRSGSQSFVVGPLLQEMFANTSLSKVHADDLKLPYPGFFVALPDCPWQVWGGSRTRWHQVTGVYVTRYDCSESTGIAVYVWGKENSRSRFLGDDASLWFNIDLVRAKRDFSDIESYIVHMMAQDCESSLEIDGEGDRDVRRELAIHITRVIFNLTQYLGSEGAETELWEPGPRRRQRRRIVKKIRGSKGQRRARLESELRQLDEAGTITRVGSSIERRIQVDVEKSYRGPVKRHWVRGHWRDVPHKTASGERAYRRRWIQPYLRGDENLGMVSSRRYDVES